MLKPPLEPFGCNPIEFWSGECVNHAAPEDLKHGLAALRTYHGQFRVFFAAFADINIVIEQQIAEDDRVLTFMKTSVRQTDAFMGIPATGKSATLASMRIDRFENGKTAEHWSVADLSGFLQQLQS